MRTIKFRGKRLDNGKWIEGCFAEFVHPIDGDTKPGIQVTRCVPSSIDRFIPVYETELVEVLPESVGQWTGLVDRHGKEIYEGDILHRESHQDMFVEFYKGAFCLVSCNPIQRANWTPTTCRGSDIIYREIIGNVIDSPELMEVE